MIKAESFVSAIQKQGFSLWTGVPCSYLKPFINYVIDAPDLEYIGAANEGEAVAIAAGAEVAGRKAVVMFQNSGFGNTVNPLTSINMIFKIPSLVITTWRGEPGGAPDEPQHDLMGQITPQLFDTMKIRWEMFPEDESAVEGAIARAVDHMNKTKEPYGLIMRKDAVAPHALKSKAKVKTPPLAQQTPVPAQWSLPLPTRSEVLGVLQKVTPNNDAIVATTGFMGRFLYALEDRENQLYMVGGMGCATSFAYGMKLAKPNTRVVCVDGDGAALMRLSAFATLGYERPQGYVHLLLDNELHDSTGGQATVSGSIDFAGIARACGYERVVATSHLHDIEKILSDRDPRLTLIHVKITPEDSSRLPRPKVTPEFVADRMRAWYKDKK